MKANAKDNEALDVKKYAVFNAEHIPVAFYSSDVHGTIPENAVEITSDVWAEFLSNPGTRKWQDGQVVEYELPQLSEDEKSAILDKRIRAAMADEADPLMAKYLAGEVKKQVWLDKRAEIKARFNVEVQ